jgi:hypothetical protein
MRQYPIWLFHKTQCPDGKIVRSLEEETALGKGWVESPAQFDAPVVAAKDPAEEFLKPAVQALADVVAENPPPQAEEVKPAKSSRKKD